METSRCKTVINCTLGLAIMVALVWFTMLQTTRSMRSATAIELTTNRRLRSALKSYQAIPSANKIQKQAMLERIADLNPELIRSFGPIGEPTGLVSNAVEANMQNLQRAEIEAKHLQLTEEEVQIADTSLEKKPVVPLPKDKPISAESEYSIWMAKNTTGLQQCNSDYAALLEKLKGATITPADIIEIHSLCKRITLFCDDAQTKTAPRKYRKAHTEYMKAITEQKFVAEHLPDAIETKDWNAVTMCGAHIAKCSEYLRKSTELFVAASSK